MTKFCTECGKEIAAGVAFCTECGTKAPADPETATTETVIEAKDTKVETPWYIRLRHKAIRHSRPTHSLLPILQARWSARAHTSG